MLGYLGWVILHNVTSTHRYPHRPLKVGLVRAVQMYLIDLHIQFPKKMRLVEPSLHRLSLSYSSDPS
jgi:hypothetical protein